RLRVELLEAGDDPRRVEHDLAVEVNDRHKRLARDLVDGLAVGIIDPDRLDLEPLVAEGERHTLHVRGPGGAVEADHPGRMPGRDPLLASPVACRPSINSYARGGSSPSARLRLPA